MQKTMRVFEFYGRGNYSPTSGLDTGLTCRIEQELNYNIALECQAKLIEYNGWSYGLPPEPQKGIFYICNEHTGLRNVHGFVISKSEKEAQKMLFKFQNKWKPKPKNI